MQAVGQFYHDDADILRHSQKHFAVRFQLLVFFRFILHLAQFRNAVDEHSDFFPEELFHLINSINRIFDHIMQKRCGDGYVVNMQFSQNHSHMQRMCYVFFAGNALLVGMSFICQIVRF